MDFGIAAGHSEIEREREQRPFFDELQWGAVGINRLSESLEHQARQPTSLRRDLRLPDVRLHNDRGA